MGIAEIEAIFIIQTSTIITTIGKTRI